MMNRMSFSRQAWRPALLLRCPAPLSLRRTATGRIDMILQHPADARAAADVESPLSAARHDFESGRVCDATSLRTGGIRDPAGCGHPRRAAGAAARAVARSRAAAVRRTRRRVL